MEALAEFSPDKFCYFYIKNYLYSLSTVPPPDHPSPQLKIIHIGLISIVEDTNGPSCYSILNLQACIICSISIATSPPFRRKLFAELDANYEDEVGFFFGCSRYQSLNFPKIFKSLQDKFYSKVKKYSFKHNLFVFFFPTYTLSFKHCTYN